MCIKRMPPPVTLLTPLFRVVFRRKHTREELFDAINILIELPERTPVLLQFFMRRPGKQTSYASLFCYFANTIETGPGGHATLFIYDFFCCFYVRIAIIQRTAEVFRRKL